jgi:chromosome segregation ATPase
MTNSDDNGVVPSPRGRAQTAVGYRIIHSSEIADDPGGFQGDYVPLEDTVEEDALLARVRELEQRYETLKAIHDNEVDCVYQALGIRSGLSAFKHALEAVKGLQERTKFTADYESLKLQSETLQATVRELEQARDEARRAATELLTALGVAKDHIAILRDELEARDAASAEGAD